MRVRFNKGGGTMGSLGTVSFGFTHMGVFRIDPAGLDLEELELIDHGLEDFGESSGEKGEPQVVLRCALQNFGKLQAALEARGIAAISATPEYIATNPISLPEAHATQVLKLVDLLEQDEDVQHVFHSLA